MQTTLKYFLVSVSKRLHRFGSVFVCVFVCLFVCLLYLSNHFRTEMTKIQQNPRDSAPLNKYLDLIG